MATTVYENNIEYAPFNSVNQDRKINADHLARWLSSVNSDGVARKFDEFEATISNDTNVVINTGVGFVDGHHIYLKAAQSIPIAEASNSSERIDTIGFRLDVANRKVVLYYATGVAGSGVAPTPLNDSEYKEIPLYNVRVRQSATSILESDLIDVRQYVVSSATYFKRYTQSYNIDSTTNSVTITVPFNVETDDVEVWNNTNVLQSNQFSITGNVITFASPIVAGSKVQINVWHFQDGNGKVNDLNKVLEQLNEVEGVTKYYYFCTGNNDNIALSNIAQNFLQGTGDFEGIDANAQMEIVVCGNCGVSSYYSGDGSQARPYTYFAFGRAATSTRTIYFNFSNCSRITVNCSATSGVYSTIFSGADINIRNVALHVATGYNVDIFNGTNVHCEDSEFWMATTNDCCVGRCCGQFDNVRTSITSASGNAYCFYGNGNLTRVRGGTHYAWTAGSGKEAVCFYVEASQTENVLFMSMVNCPQNARSGYTQSETVKVNSGYATIMQCALWKASTLYSVENCIAYGNVIISKN